MKLNFGLNYSDLYSNEGIAKIDDLFLEYLEKEDSESHQELQDSRKSAEERFTPQLLIKLSKKLESFIAELFNIKNELETYYKTREYSKLLYEIKRNFIHRFALQKYKADDFSDMSSTTSMSSLRRQGSNQNNSDSCFRRNDIGSWNDISEISDQEFIEALSKAKEGSEEYENLAKYAAHRIYTGKTSPLFSKPEKQDFDNLVRWNKIQAFAGMTSKQNDNNQYPYLESSYCINCHKTKKDSCSSGMKEGDGFKKNALGNILSGCPLNIKISEMNEVFAGGNPVSALSIITMDNPLVALTGKRICNDCSKACIYQKQTPVDIPSIESQILEDVLKLPYGFEIYSLLTRWLLLKPKEYLPSSSKDKKILVVGTGPAGIALSHYLLQSGCSVTAIDGLKIEPLPPELVNNPIKDFRQIKEAYYNIKPQGFGGVAEYGITDRWDKTNLITARLLLEKRQNFELHGGVKFGANINYGQAKELGFDHIALACGSGYPNVPSIKNISAGNVRTASDFLMSLGSGGLLNENSSTNFMIELPAIVVGAGLTAIDAATEITKYYPLLAKRVHAKLHDKDLSFLNESDRAQALRLIEHGGKYLHEDELAKSENRLPDYRELTDSFGGVSICYRKDIKQSPAYRINHHELQDALSASVRFYEDLGVSEIEVDEFGNCSGVKFEVKTLPARTILFGTGTSPLSKIDATNEECEYDDISIFGDMDKDYSGSVVKAIASAKDGYRKIISISSLRRQGSNQNNLDSSFRWNDIVSRNDIFTAKIVDVIHYNSEIFELKIYAPLLAKNYKPGQFFKLQNFHSKSNKSFEPLSLTGAWIENDTISTLVQIVGESSKAASKLKKGDLISLMGPSGEASFIPKNSSIILIGGGGGTAALFPYAKALKENGNKIIFLAAYRKKEHCIYPKKIREYADFALFACDESKLFEDSAYEKSIEGNVIDALKQVDLTGIKNLFVVGSSNMMNAVSEFVSNKNGLPRSPCSLAMTEELKPIASINAPMQCMLGGVCGTCLMQTESNNKLVFICKNQDQKLSTNIMKSLKTRLCQNSLLEKI